MHAAVLHTLGKPPRFETFPDPTPADGEVIVHVSAAALKPVDRQMAAGTHYASPRAWALLVPNVGGTGPRSTCRSIAESLFDRTRVQVLWAGVRSVRHGLRIAEAMPKSRARHEPNRQATHIEFAWLRRHTRIAHCPVALAASHRRSDQRRWPEDSHYVSLPASRPIRGRQCVGCLAHSHW